MKTPINPFHAQHENTPEKLLYEALDDILDIDYNCVGDIKEAIVEAMTKYSYAKRTK